MGIAVITFIGAYVRRYVGGRVALDVQYDLRTSIFERLQRLDLAGHDRMRTGQLVSRASSDVGLLQGILSFLPITAGNLVTLIVSVVVMAVLSPILTAVALVAVPALLIVMVRLRLPRVPGQLGRAAAGRRGGRGRRGGGLGGPGGEGLRPGAPHDRRPDRPAPRGSSARGPGSCASRPATRRCSRPSRRSSQVLVLVLGGWLVINGRITLGTFLAFASYLVQLVAPVADAGRAPRLAQQARAGGERVLELLDSDLGGDRAARRRTARRRAR